MQFANFHNEMTYFAGGPSFTPATVDFLQQAWDVMYEMYPLFKDWNWLPEGEVKDEFLRNQADPGRMESHDDLDREIYNLSLAFSACGAQSTAIFPDIAMPNGTAECLTRFMYAMRNWNGVMDAHWAAA